MGCLYVTYGRERIEDNIGFEWTGNCRTLADISGSPLTGDENTGGRKWDANVQWTGAVDKNGRVTEAQADNKWMLVGYGQKWTYVERSGRKVDATRTYCGQRWI